MSVSRRGNVIASALAAGLCVALPGCEPNSAPRAEQARDQAEQAPAGAPATAAAPQAPALQELDAVARATELTPSKLCNLEFLDGNKFGGNTISPNDIAATEFRGWVGDETTGKRPVDARLRIATPNHQRAWEVPVGSPVARQDVAKYANIPTLADAGFQATVDLTPLPQGDYRVYLVFSGPTGGYRCDNGRRITR